MADEIIYSITFEGLEESNRKLDQVNKRLIEQKKEVDSTKKAIKELEDIRKKEGELTSEQSEQLDRLNNTLLTQQDELKKTNSVRRDSVKETELLNKALNSNAGSNDQLKAKLALLTKEYNSLSEEQRENTEGGKQLQAEILGITEKLKGNEKAIGDNRRNVGNYEQAITSALGKVNIMGVNLGQLTTEVKQNIAQGKGLVNTIVAQTQATVAQATATTGATTASGALSGALKVLRVALIATGIGAIVIALTALAAGFATTQRGADAFTRAITPIRFIFDRLLGVLQELSFAFVDFIKSAFEDPLQTFKDFNKSIVNFVLNPIDSLKRLVNGAKNSFQELREEMKKAARDGKEYANAEIALEKAVINSQVALAKLNVQIQKNREIASNQLATDKERINALTLSKKAIQDKYDLENGLLQREINLLELKIKQNDTDRDAQLELAKLKARQIQLEADKFAEQKRITSQLTALQKKEQDAVEAVTDAIETKSKTQIEVLEEEIRARDKNLKTQLVNLEFQKNKELENTQLTADEKLAIEKKFEQDKAQLQLDALQQQAEAIKAQLEPIFADASGLGAILLTPEEETLLKEQLNTINAEMAKIGQTISGVEGETAGVNLLNGLGLDDEGMETLMMSIDIVKQAISGIGEVMQSITARNTKLIQDQVREGVLTQDQADRKIEELERKSFKRQKAFNIALALTNGAQGVLKSIATLGPPVPPNVQGILGVASAGLATATQIATISAQKFATGGYVSGPGTATSDSIPAWLSNGEYVINAGAVKTLGVDYLNAINSIKMPKFATGGLVTPQPIPTTSTSSTQVEQLSQQVQSQEIRVINVESDFSSLQNKVQNVERAGTF